MDPPYSELPAKEERARLDNVLHAIQAALERLAPADFESIEDARAQLASAAQTAENPFTRPPYGDIERKAMDEERVLFAEFVRCVGEDELARVEPVCTGAEGYWVDASFEWLVYAGAY